MTERQLVWLFRGISLMLTSGALAGSQIRNVALKQPAVQSSLGDPLGGPGGAVDGSKEVRFEKGSCITTQEESDPWWRVDLGQVYKISAVTVTNRKHNPDQLDGAEIWIGNSPETNDTKRIRCAVISNLAGGRTVYYPCRAMQGRYVSVLLPGSNKTLSLCEVEVFSVTHAYPLPNLALKGDATQSSTFGFATASKAVDGNRNSFFTNVSCSSTEVDVADPWWRVDLLRTYVVAYVKVTNRGDCCPERLDGAQIRIGDSLENNGNDNARCVTIGHIRAGKTNTFYCDGGSMEGRYVNLIIPGQGKTLTLCEVEVYAAPTVEPLQDVAFKKPTAQTWSSYPPFNAVSGCRGGFLYGGCCSYTFSSGGSWWRVDLRDVYRVSVITVTSAVDCCYGNLEEAQIRIGDSSTYNGNPICATVKSTVSTSAYAFDCAGMKGRYVTVLLRTYRALVLCDVGVFASLAEPKVVAPTPPPTLPPPPLPPSVSLALGGLQLVLVGERLCWSDALAFCRRHHWDLLSIVGEEQQSAVETLLDAGHFALTDAVWVGLRRYLMRDIWFWMSGDNMEFTKWQRDSAPHHHASPCGGVARVDGFAWDDQPCEALLNFVCQTGAWTGAERVNYHSSLDAKGL